MREDKFKIISSYLCITLLFVVALGVYGYFSIGYLSDDYINYYSANVSSLNEKFAGNVVYYNNLLFRPFWFLSLSMDLSVKSLLHISSDNFIVSRIHNLILYLSFAFLVSYFLFTQTGNYIHSLLLYIVILVFPNNLHSLLWIVCRNDLQFGIFGLFSLFLIYLYKRNGKIIFLIFSLLSFGISLLFKETAIIIPFIIVLSFYHINRDNHVLKLRDVSIHFLLLILYVLYKIVFLNSSVGKIASYYSFSIADRFYVLPKALFSLFSSTDYLTANYLIRLSDIPHIALIIFPFLMFCFCILLIYKEKYKRLLVYPILFVLCIIPNLIAGYFRPQLIIFPFSIIALFFLFDSSYIKRIKYNIIGYIFIVLIMFFIYNSLGVINDYKLSYNKVVKDIDMVSDEIPGFKRKPVFLFIPSRLKQTYILDYISPAYNYFKYKDFVLMDTIYSFVNYAALDYESLNSEIVIEKLNDSTITAFCSGATQYFYNLKNNSISDYENDFIKCEFGKNNLFLNKSKKIKLTLKNTSEITYIALANNKPLILNTN